MRFEKDQSPKQKYAVLLGFLRSECKGMELDAIKAGQLMVKLWGLYEDWHPFVDALEILVSHGEAVIIKPGGFTQYKILLDSEKETGRIE